MSVTVEVRGVPAGGGNTGAGGGGGQSAGGGVHGGLIPSDDRIMADARREMQARGVIWIPGATTSQQFINQFGQQLRQSAAQNISSQYEARRQSLTERRREAYDAVEADVEQYRSKTTKTNARLHPSARMSDDELEENISAYEAEKYRKASQKFDQEESSINSEEEAAQRDSEKELIDALKRLTDSLDREAKGGGAGEDSYIGRLRAQQRALIQKRDAATTEEEIIAANKELGTVNTKLRKATTMGQEPGYFYDPVLQTTQGIASILGAGDNVGGAIQGAGGLIAGLSGMSMSSALKFMGWVGLAAGAGNWLAGGRKTYESLHQLAGWRSPAGGRSGADAMEELNSVLPIATYKQQGQIGYTELGYGRDDFIKQAETRIAQRNTANDWYDEVIRQMALEASFGLSDGALGRAGQFDRYGKSGTTAIVDLAALLHNIDRNADQKLGVNWNDFVQMEEKLDIQQKIMAGYKQRTNLPSYDVANQMIGAFMAVNGGAKDDRLWGDYSAMSSALQNPMNDRMRTFIYSTIEDVIPGTQGRLDLIDRALRDPKNEGTIMQAVIQRMTEMFGGTDTQMGYFAFKSVFGDSIAPEHMDAYIRDFSKNPYAPDGTKVSQMTPAQILSGRINFGDTSSIVDSLTVQAKDFTTAFTRMSAAVSDAFRQLSDLITGLAHTF